MKFKKVKALLVEVGKEPVEVIVENSIKEISKILGFREGDLLDSVIDYDNGVEIIVHDLSRGKFPLNRIVFNERGTSPLLIYGNFLLMDYNLTSENFEGLSPETIAQCLKMYQLPNKKDYRYGL